MSIPEMTNILTKLKQNEGLTTLSQYDRYNLRGCGFISSAIIPSIPFGTTITNRLHTSSEKYSHFVSILVSLEGATCTAKLIKRATVDTLGTLVPGAYQNLNDVSVVEPGIKVYQGSTYTGGIVQKQIVLHGNTTALSTTGTSFVELVYDRLVSDKDSDYFFQITNDGPSEDTAYRVNIMTTLYELPFALEEGYT